MNKIRETKVLSVFRGIGKSYALYNCKEMSILDMDSWNWRLREKETDTRWELKFIEVLKEAIESEKYDFIFVSFNTRIRNLLNENQIHYTLVYPKNDLYTKEKYIERYIKDKMSVEEISSIQNNWPKMLTEFLSHEKENENYPHIIVSEDYISEMLRVRFFK